MRRSFSIVVASLSALGALFALIACSGGSAEPSTPDPDPRPSAPIAPPVPAEARAVWDEPSFELRAEAAGPFTAGTQGQFTIRLTPRGAFHVNHDYPMSVTVTGPAAVTFPSATLAADRAATFTERLAQFDVPFTATAGAHHVTALVDFAVCTPEACMPDTRTVAIDLSVN